MDRAGARVEIQDFEAVAAHEFDSLLILRSLTFGALGGQCAVLLAAIVKDAGDIEESDSKGDGKDEKANATAGGIILRRRRRRSRGTAGSRETHFKRTSICRERFDGRGLIRKIAHDGMEVREAENFAGAGAEVDGANIGIVAARGVERANDLADAGTIEIVNPAEIENDQFTAVANQVETEIMKRFALHQSQATLKLDDSGGTVLARIGAKRQR
jgi:hypothetical protein